MIRKWPAKDFPFQKFLLLGAIMVFFMSIFYPCESFLRRSTFKLNADSKQEPWLKALDIKCIRPFFWHTVISHVMTVFQTNVMRVGNSCLDSFGENAISTKLCNGKVNLRQLINRKSQNKILLFFITILIHLPQYFMAEIPTRTGFCTWSRLEPKSDSYS